MIGVALPPSVRQLFPWLALGHGVYNTLLFMLFLYQGRLGWVIRGKRLAAQPQPLAAMRRHRKWGPILVILGVLGFLAGVSLVMLDKGRLVQYPLHLFLGLLLVAAMFTQYLVAKKIKGPRPAPRNLHAGLGVFLLLVFLIQAVIGLGILL